MKQKFGTSNWIFIHDNFQLLLALLVRDSNFPQHFTFCLLLCQTHEYPKIYEKKVCIYLFILNWIFLQLCGQHIKSRNNIWHNDSLTVVNRNIRNAWYTKHTDLQLVGCGSTLSPLPVVLDNKAFSHGAHCSVRRFVMKEWEPVPLLSCNLSREKLTFIF